MFVRARSHVAVSRHFKAALAAASLAVALTLGVGGVNHAAASSPPGLTNNDIIIVAPPTLPNPGPGKELLPPRPTPTPPPPPTCAGRTATISYPANQRRIDGTRGMMSLS